MIPKNANVGTTYAVSATGKTSKACIFTSYQVTSSCLLEQKHDTIHDLAVAEKQAV